MIKIFSSTDKLVRTIGNGVLEYPAGMVISGKFIYVAQPNDSRIVVLNLEDGEKIKHYGATGSTDGNFNWPVALAMDYTEISNKSEEHLIVSDSGNNRLQWFR